MIATLLAPAKLTLSLRITGRRSDGYHLIDAEMVTLDLADRLTIDPDGHGVTAHGPFSAGVPLDATNLAARALRLVGRTAAVDIDKRIPHGGGLGGGSADAAAVLRWAAFSDLDAASRLGADIPFCLVGGRARVRGIGEILTPMTRLNQEFTLVIPPLSCSTPAVYRAWDELETSVQTHARNDLQPAALIVEPRLAGWRDRIAEASGATPTLAGSGATWFVEGHHPGLDEALPDAVVVMTRAEVGNGGDQVAENDDDRPPK